ncbi:MAG: ornithine carbamoyltransferase [Candidatus Nitrospinota bacterium M3_3B_026]
MKKDLVRLTSLDREEIEDVLKTAAALKGERGEGVRRTALEGKTLGLIFNKSSTRTRVSFEVGIAELGGHAIFLQGGQLQMTRGETVADTAKVFSRYLNGIVIRTYSQAEVEQLAAEADIPVINALTDMYHPCQILSDLFTITEKKGGLDGVKVAYVGDGNNVANSWLLGAAVMGMSLAVATPKGYEPEAAVVEEAMTISSKSGAKVEITSDPAAAAKGADVLYTDTWISMGMEDEQEKRLAAFKNFQVNQALVDRAAQDVMVMHCLPAHRGEEISADVLDGPRSAVWDQAENRLHTQKAILLKLFEK